MKIKYFGNSSFLLSIKESKLVTNPVDKNVKINLAKIAPDIVVQSHKSKLKDGKFYNISSPGEYEVGDIFVNGYISSLSEDENVADIYMFDLEGVHVGMIDKNVKTIRTSVLNEISISNVLLVSLAEDAGIKLSKMTDLVNKIDPQIVIPMDFSDKNLADFAKVLGVQDLETVPNISIKRSDFVDEEMPLRVVVLNK